MTRFFRYLVCGATVCTVATALPQTFPFAFTGSDQVFVVPANVHSLHVKLWGAGGGNSGGSAAFVSGYLAVNPGEILTIVVGGSAGGVYYNQGPGGRTYGGGGSSYGFSDVLAGVGGGRSAIRRGGADIVTAAGGGGGMYVTIGAHNRRGGGYGGILQGGDGEGSNAGKGGTQTSGGMVNGGLYQGGDPIGPGCGGGGGFYGGGGGYGADVSQYSLFPGGGGSSLISNLTSVVAEQGRTGSSSMVLPGGASDSDYVQGIGIGARPGVGQNGGYGRVVLAVAPVPEPASALILAASLGLVRLLRKRVA